MKKCPNCSIITEKTAGCNHITCSKGNFQWCWLCNKKYSYAHYQQGKCRGYQFFKPKDEYDIKLAFEGKIKLRASQRQEDLIYIDDNFNYFWQIQLYFYPIFHCMPIYHEVFVSIKNKKYVYLNKLPLYY